MFAKILKPLGVGPIIFQDSVQRTFKVRIEIQKAHHNSLLVQHYIWYVVVTYSLYIVLFSYFTVSSDKVFFLDTSSLSANVLIDTWRVIGENAVYVD